MANIGMIFDATKYEPATASGSQLPPSDNTGWPCVIVSSEMKETKDKTGGYLELVFQIIEGDHKGMEGTFRLNLFNKNETATAIAYKQLSAICHCTGVMQVQDSSQLHHKPLRALVRLQRDPEAAAKGFTEIYGVVNADGSQPGKGGQRAATAPAAPAAPPVAPPQAPVAAPAAPEPVAAPVAPAAPVQAPVAPVAAPEAPAAPAPWAQAPAGGSAPPWAK